MWRHVVGLDVIVDRIDDRTVGYDMLSAKHTLLLFRLFFYLTLLSSCSLSSLCLYFCLSVSVTPSLSYPPFHLLTSFSSYILLFLRFFFSFSVLPPLSLHSIFSPLFPSLLPFLPSSLSSPSYLFIPSDLFFCHLSFLHPSPPSSFLVTGQERHSHNPSCWKLWSKCRRLLIQPCSPPYLLLCPSSSPWLCTFSFPVTVPTCSLSVSLPPSLFLFLLLLLLLLLFLPLTSPCQYLLPCFYLYLLSSLSYPVHSPSSSFPFPLMKTYTYARTHTHPHTHAHTHTRAKTFLTQSSYPNQSN